MKTAPLGLCGVLTLGALVLTGCNADQDSAVAVGPTQTVIRTVTATATAPAAGNTPTQAPRHTASAKGTKRANTHSAQAARPTTHTSATTTAPKAAPPAPARTTQPAPRTTIQPPAPAKTTANSGACNIKGNISSEGEKIYHLPGQRYYDVTKISLGKGERWFCSEQDALSAGWRKALV